MVAETTSRVADNTPEHVNAWIRCCTEQSVHHLAENPDLISMRLRQLDREWNVERALEANAASFALFGLVLGLRKRGWLGLPIGVAGFLLQHAVEGWCPPLSVLRRLGFRTSREIEEERGALKALRGDFAVLPADAPAAERARRALEAARAR
ncbi:hypothetical protein [Marinimicrococcus flavescens]|uniref:DUF2892 domain-containing protein n=1 Tax=Marinimicrococcus flavescens TaxID=3031815 RepID=A0AAP4D4T0_9PROT|nr:DUF2892 domain-containing protein [Marinimicrococcus flavescens]